MNIQLIQGDFNAKEGLDLITQMIQIKIKYHENKIATHSSEEDIKFRESKIKKLHKELFDLRTYADQLNGSIKIDATINIKTNE